MARKPGPWDKRIRFGFNVYRFRLEETSRRRQVKPRFDVMGN